MEKRWLLLVVVLLNLIFISYFVESAGDESIIFLTHSTGENLYNEGNVSSWFTTYNTDHGTSYDMNRRYFPDSPYPWANYPYDYWRIWVDSGYSCSSSDWDIGCLDMYASNYDVVIWKHCYPGSNIYQDAATGNLEDRTTENYKTAYRALRAEMDSYPDTLFIVFTIPPRHRLYVPSSGSASGNAQRATDFAEWVKTDWLTEDAQPHPNIYIFDFRYYLMDPSNNYLNYSYERSHSSSDSHPNTLANQNIGPIFSQFVVDSIEDFYPSGPGISSVSDGGSGLIHGSDYTISGSGFGTKSPVAPVRFDNFEDGNLGERVKSWSEGGWNSRGGNGVYPHYSQDRTRIPSEKVIKQSYLRDGLGHYNQMIGMFRQFSFDELYATWWAYRDDFDGTALCSDNHKLLGNLGMSPGAIDYGYPQQRVDQYSQHQNGHLYSTQYTGSNHIHDHFSFDDSKWLDNWHRVERYSDTRTRDNYAYVKRNGETIAEISGDFKGTDDPSYDYNYFQLGHYFRLFCEILCDPGDPYYGCTSELIHYLDDLYLDTTPARIEVCDTSNFNSASKHCEIQIPHTTWDDGTIRFTANQGTFSQGESLYLFVVDANRNVLSGYPLTFSSGSAPTCGDNTVNQGFEVCDGTDLQGESCSSQGFDGGTLGCDLDCLGFDTSGCYYNTCSLTSASWSATEVENNTQVTLTVTGDNCDGESISFEILEYDAAVGNDDVTSQLSNPPAGATFSGTTATQTWNAEWLQDTGIFTDDDPEYNFNAILDSDPAENVETTEILKVTLPPEAICGDNTVNQGFEVCDGTDLQGESCSSQGFDGGTLGCDLDCLGFDTSGCYYCGDGSCNGVETCDDCSQDCGTCPVCSEGQITDWCSCGGTNYNSNYCCQGVYQTSPCLIVCSLDSECDYLDNLPCIDGICNATGACEVTYTTASCDDGISCTENDICSLGSCTAGTPNDSLCADNPNCNIKTCTVSGCQYSDCSGGADDALLWLPFDTDYQDHSNSGFSVSCTDCPTQTSGQINGAYSFDGVSDYLDFGDVLNLNTLPITMMAWVNHNGGTTNPIISTDDQDSNYFLGSYMFISSDNTLVAGYGDRTPSQKTRIWSTPNTVDPGEWHHVAIVLEGNSPGQVTAYFDGVQVDGDYTYDISVPGFTTDPLTVGRRRAYTNSYFNGALDDVRIYNRALSQPEIQDLMSGTSVTYCTDVDGDGWALESSGCDLGSLSGYGDCDDGDNERYPGNSEVCDNKDNNCASGVDEGLTRATTCGVGECSSNTGVETCTAGVWGGDTCDPLAGATTEVCDNQDNDCDGSIDENVARATYCGVGACAGNAGIEICTAGVWGSNNCDPFSGATTEVCDGSVDEDCDGSVDEGCNCIDGQVTQCGTTDVGLCEYGNQTCSGGVWGTCVGSVEPVAETCDGLDNDCDSQVDEEDVCIVESAQQIINLNPGWNLISLNISANIYSSDLNSLFVMRYEDGSWITDWQILSGDEFSLEPLRGYYVYSSSSSTVILSGLELDPGYKYDLVDEEWNLFSVSTSNSYSSIYNDVLSETYSLYETDGSSIIRITNLASSLNSGSFYWANLKEPDLSPPAGTLQQNVLGSLAEFFDVLLDNFR